MSDSEASHAALPRNFYDKPDYSSEDDDDLSIGAGSSRRHRRPASRPAAGGQLDNLLSTLRNSCCFPMTSSGSRNGGGGAGGAAAIEESVTYTSTTIGANPLLAAGSFVDDEDDDDDDSVTSTSSEDELAAKNLAGGGRQRVQTLAKERNVDYASLPNVSNLERLARWHVETPLVWCFENGFLDLTLEQRAYAALQWIRGETSGSRMTEKALKQLLAGALRVSKVRKVEKILETDSQFATLAFGGNVGVSDLDGVGGEMRRVTELYHDGSLFLVIQSGKHSAAGRVVAVTSCLKGEMWQHKVFDVGLTQTRGPSVYSFDRADDAEALLMALMDKSSSGPFTVSRVINPSLVAAAQAQLPPSSEASVEGLQTTVVPVDESAVEGDPEMADFRRVYGAMNRAVDPDKQGEEVQFAVDPAARLVVHKRVPRIL